MHFIPKKKIFLKCHIEPLKRISLIQSGEKVRKFEPLVEVLTLNSRDHFSTYVAIRNGEMVLEFFAGFARPLFASSGGLRSNGIEKNLNLELLCSITSCKNRALNLPECSFPLQITGDEME